MPDRRAMCFDSVNFFFNLIPIISVSTRLIFTIIFYHKMVGIRSDMVDHTFLFRLHATMATNFEVKLDTLASETH